MPRSPWWRVAVPMAVIGLGLLLSSLTVRGGHAPYSLLVLTVMVSAWYGGHVMGLVATIVSVVGAVLIPLDADLPHALSQPGSVLQLMLFAGVGALTSNLVDRQRRQRVMLEDLKAHSVRLAEVMRSIGIGHWYSDLPSQLMHWDEQCCAQFGLAPETALTLERFYACVHPDDRESVQREAERAVFGHASCDVDFRVVHADGVVHWVKVLGRGFYDDAGRPTRFEGITVDITAQKSIEAALADTNRMKDEFLSTVSHELRTPLNAVLGWTRLLAGGKLPQQRVSHALSVIERNAQLQARLVEDLLDLSSIITGRLRLRIEPVDLGTIVNTAVEAVRPAADARNIGLAATIHDDARWVTGDGDRLRQVTWNLLANAVKYTPEGGRILIELRAADARVFLRVRDTGIGIEPAFLPRVFDRFSQALPPDTSGIRGLGLGLAIVRELVEAHGGGVEAYSAGRGRGATFTVSLPGRLASQAPADLAAQRALPG